MRVRPFSLAFAGVGVLTLVIAAACSNNSSSPTVPSPPPSGGGGGAASTATVTIAGFAFSPNPISVKAGGSVAWKNTDSVSHTATADAGSFDTGVIAPGATSNAVTMPTAGTFTYHCQIHPFMVATINVTQ